ncbi:MAG: hypothetical protein ACI9K3_001014, partial [Halovenus sp.]
MTDDGATVQVGEQRYRKLASEPGKTQWNSVPAVEPIRYSTEKQAECLGACPPRYVTTVAGANILLCGHAPNDMATIQNEILTTLFKDGRDGTEMLPVSLIISECEAAGYEASAVTEELAALVERSRLSEADDHYALAGAASLSLTTHR